MKRILNAFIVVTFSCSSAFASSPSCDSESTEEKTVSIIQSSSYSKSIVEIQLGSSNSENPTGTKERHVSFLILLKSATGPKPLTMAGGSVFDENCKLISFVASLLQRKVLSPH